MTKAQTDVGRRARRWTPPSGCSTTASSCSRTARSPRSSSTRPRSRYTQAKAQPRHGAAAPAGAAERRRQGANQHRGGAGRGGERHYESAQAQASYAEIRSPITGVVTDRPLYPGEMAAAGAPMLTVMDVSKVVARVNMAQDQAKNVKVGNEATITPTDGGELVSPAASPSSARRPMRTAPRCRSGCRPTTPASGCTPDRRSTSRSLPRRSRARR